MLPRRFLNIAHRGFSSRYPENTMLAFERALELPVRRVELDVNMTADGALVVMHDLKVDRTTDGRGKVSDLRLAEVKALDAGRHKGEAFAGERVPTLDETLDRLKGRTKFVVEMKFDDPAHAAALVNAVTTRKLEGDVVFSSFRLDNLRAAGRLLPGASLNPLVGMQGRTVAAAVEETLALKANVLGMAAADTTSELVQAAHDAGLLLRCWGAADDRGPEIRRLIAIGADGMTTNYPDVVGAILKEEGIAPW